MLKEKFYIRSMRLAGYLMQRGFVLQSIDKSNDGSRRNVFLFNKNDDLLHAIESYKQIH